MARHTNLITAVVTIVVVLIAIYIIFTYWGADQEAVGLLDRRRNLDLAPELG